jgi:hypothetical protein
LEEVWYCRKADKNDYYFLAKGQIALQLGAVNIQQSS